MTVNPGAGAIEGHTELMVAPATLEKLARAYIATYHGPHGDAPVADAVTGPVDMSAAGRLMSPNLLCGALSAWQAETARRDTRRGLSVGRPRRVRPRHPDRHRPRDAADGLRHRAAAPARGGLQGDHEPDSAGAARRIRRAARHPTRRRGRQVPERRRRGVDSRPAVQIRRSQGRRRGQATAAQRDGRRPPGRARFAGTDGNAARPGQRTRHRPRGAVPQRRPQGCRGAAAMARGRAFRVARLSALPGLGR